MSVDTEEEGGGGGAATVNAYAVFKYKSLSSKLMPLERWKKFEYNIYNWGKIWI